ncbi:MAG: SRPBCC domain-containing protein [Alphaproteobacteria bacterium]|nr:SRPBCC domain-containing protein [Alphaproteobacteria bacterium]
MLRIVRRVSACLADVFSAWTEPTQFMAWWGPSGCVIPKAELDVRPGGRYRVEMVMPGRNPFELSSTYVAVEPPRRLVYTWSWRGSGSVRWRRIVGDGRVSRRRQGRNRNRRPARTAVVRQGDRRPQPRLERPPR